MAAAHDNQPAASAPEPARRSWDRLAFALALASYAVHSARLRGWLVDDAAISFAAAHNLANGAGPVLHPLGEQIEAYSNPLWTLPLALAALTPLGLEGILAAAKLASLALGLATLVLVRLLANATAAQLHPTDAPARPAVGGLACLLLAWHQPFVIWTASGLEGPLVVFLAVLAALLALRSGPTPALGLVLGLLALTRPDGVVYFLGVPPLLWALTPGAPRAPWRWARRALPALAVGLIPVLAYSAWRWSYFASWLPNTFHAKLEGAPLAARLFDPRTEGWVYVAGWLRVYALGPAALVGIVAACVAARRRPRAVAPALAFAALGLALPVYAGGDWMRFHRFMLAVAPFAAVLAAVGAGVLVRARAGGTARWAVAAAVLALGLAHAAAPAGTAWPSDPEISVARITARADYFRKVHAELGLTRNPVLLDPDLGATSLYSGMKVIDTWGLGSRAFAGLGRRPHLSADYVLQSLRPQYVHIFTYWDERTRILLDPRWYEAYVLLPAYRMPDGTEDGGNWIRRDLLTATPPPEARLAQPLELAGFRLVAVGPQRLARGPEGGIELELYWEKVAEADGAPWVVLAAARADGWRRELRRHALFGGLVEPRRLRAGDIYREKVRIAPGELAGGEGEPADRLVVALGTAGGLAEVGPVAAVIPIEPARAKEAVCGDLAAALERQLAEAPPAVLAWERLREAGGMRLAAAAAPGDLVAPPVAAAAQLDTLRASCAPAPAQAADRLLAWWSAWTASRPTPAAAQAAVENLHSALTLEPADLSRLRAAADALAARAEASLAAGWWADGVRTLDTSLALDPRRPERRVRAESFRGRLGAQELAVLQSVRPSPAALGHALGCGPLGGALRRCTSARPGEAVRSETLWRLPPTALVEWLWIDDRGAVAASHRSGPTGGTSAATLIVPADARGVWRLLVLADGAPALVEPLTMGAAP